MAKSRAQRNNLSSGTDTRAGIPRQRMKVNGNSVLNDSIQFQSQKPLFDVATGASSQTTWRAGVAAVTTTQTTIPLQYAQYRTKRFTLRYRPSCGVTTAGRVWVAFFNNPETCLKLLDSTITTGDAQLLVKYAHNMKTWPVHQPFDYSIDPSMRSRLYSNDMTIGTTAEAVGRALHGVFVIFTEGAPFSTTCGTVFLDGSVSLHELNTSAYNGTAVAAARAGLPYIVQDPPEKP